MEYNLKKLVASMWEHRKNKDFGLTSKTLCLTEYH